MKLRVYPLKRGASIEGSVEAPPSKSYTHRVLFASLLACGESRILNPLLSGDTGATLHAVRRLGGRIRPEGSTLRVEGVCGEPDSPPWIYCAGSGTTLRISTAIASLPGDPVLLYGDSTLKRRPMSPLLAALEELGARTLSREGYPPVVVKGPLKRLSETSVEGSISSQFVTALLMIGPLLGLRVTVLGELRSAPYINITLDTLEAFGVKCRREGYRVFECEESTYKPGVFEVPGDYSSASFILALGAMAGRVRVTGLRRDDPQGDRYILEILRSMGAKVRAGDGYVEVESTGSLEAIDVNLRDTPDLAPVVAALAAVARGVSRVRGIEHLAYKESDRIASIRGALRRLGVKVSAGEGELVIRGGRVKGGMVDAFSDHRIAMMLAIIAVKADGPVEILGAERIRDSYPQFVSHLRGLGVELEVNP